jgi:hypothetical protein
VEELLVNYEWLKIIYLQGLSHFVIKFPQIRFHTLPLTAPATSNFCPSIALPTNVPLTAPTTGKMNFPKMPV